MNFQIGLTGLRTSQYGLSTIAHNLANANTEGYHRQLISQHALRAQEFNGFYFGSGVETRFIDRARNQIVESSYTLAISDFRNIEQQLALETQIEGLFLPGEGSVANSLNTFFDELSTLSANPTEVVQRNSVVQEGINLAERVRNVSNKLVEMKSTVATQIELELDILNRELIQLNDLQLQIKTSQIHSTPNDLFDRRDQLINQIAEKIDIVRIEHTQAGFGLTMAGHSINIGDVPFQFETQRDADGMISFRVVGTEKSITFESGSLNSLQQTHNETIDSFKERIEDFASTLIRNVDQIHARGVGASGPFNVLAGTRSVEDITAPLASAGAFPIEAGELHFSVTDSSGERRTHSLAIDPTVDSLQDLAARISTIPGLNGSISTQTNQLSISASPGFKFDFSGNLETIPDLASFAGSSTPRFSGRYEGTDNQDLTVQIVGTGTIGITPGLTARVFNDAGEVVKELDIGDTYEAGSELTIVDGVKLSFAAGDINNGDSFGTSLIANSDTTGTLSALGLNSFFTGTGASNIGVTSRIVEDPDQLATSKTGDNGDTFNLSKLVDLRDDLLLGDETLSFDDFLGETASQIGFQVQTSQQVFESMTNLKSGYELQRAAVSGVDVNEELLNLAKFQKAYEASIQVVRTMETMMDELFQIIR